LAKGCGVEVLRIENSIDWTTTTLSPPPLGGLRTVLGEAICFQEALGKYLLLRRSLEKNFMVVRGPEKGGGRGGCKLRGSAGRFQGGVMVVQKAVGLAPSGAEKTSAMALRSRTSSRHPSMMDATESKARRSSDPGKMEWVARE
jgi:hypothetical protein